MENLEKSVYVLGFPQGLNKFKVKLFVEKQIGAGVKSVEKEGNLAIITFENFDDLRRFQNSEIKNINFGGSVHDLRILSNHEDKDIQQEPHHESLPGPLSARVHGNSSNKIIKQERKLLDCVSQETLFNKVHYWSDLPVLPAPEGTQCVLAQNISLSNSIQKMTLHFQNKRRNGGGPIKCFIQMVDGLLVVFNDIKHSESCLHTINQSLDGKKISIFRKVIPEYYTNKFVLEVIGESKTVEHETLELYLESCSPNETSPTACNEQEKSGVYLIEYGDDYDYSETEELLQKIHSKPLEGKSLKAAPLLKTDCLKVIGVTSDISNDAMRLQFESTKRTNGGPVTRIDRLKTQSALVYFCSYIVAGKVHQKLGGDMKIGKHPVKFELYHHSVSNDHNDNIITNFQQTFSHQQESDHVPEDQLGLFLLKLSCDEAIFHFISGNRSHAEKLRQIFINIAEVKFMSQPDLHLEFTPLKDCKESEENFHKDCDKGVRKFLSEYATVSCTFEQSKLERARSYNLYPEIEQTYMKSTKSDDVIVCWKSNEPVIQITGLKSSIKQMSKQIESHVNSVVVRTQSNQRQFRTYCYCGIVDEIRKMYPDVKIEIDEKIFLLQLSGLESMVYTANMQAMTMLNEIDKNPLTGLDESIISFILEFLSAESDLDVKLHKNFKSAGIKGVIERNGDKLCLKVKPNEDYKRAVEVIEQFIIVEEIVTDEAASRIVTSSSSWREFQKKLQKGLCSIHIKSNKNIVITGLRDDLDLLKVKIKKFLDENSDGIFVGGKKRAPDIEAGHVTEDQLWSVLKPSCDEAIYNFISGNISHAEKLKQLFINIAEVKFMSQPDFQLEFTSLKDCKESKENFFTHCEKTVNKFLSEYATVSCTFEQSRLDRARSQDLYPEIEKRYKRKANSDDIIVCWKSNEPVVQITGLKSSVEQMSKQIENHVNSVVVRTQSNQRQFRTYCYCGIVDDIREMYPDVKIELDEKNFVLQLTGLESMIYPANMQAMTMLNEIDRNHLTDLDGSIISFILEFLSPESDLDMKLHNNFKSAGIKGVIERNGDKLCLKVKPNEDYKKAVEVIKQFIIVEEIDTPQSESGVVASSSWREFQQKLQKGLYSICITSNKNIVMTGLREDLKLLKEKIIKFFDENLLKTFSLPMAYGCARYIVEKSYEFSRKSCENKEIECGLTPDNGGGIYVKGKKMALDIAISEAQKLQGNILEVVHCLNEPGIRQHYQSLYGLRFIKSTELLTECIITTLSPDCEERFEFNKGLDKPTQTAISQLSAVDIQKFKVASNIFNSVELSVWKTDITKHKCDVIVNATNHELKLSGGISGAIRAQDEKNGNGQVQKELDAIIKKNYGSILAGDAVITSAGNLPACKKIVHAAGPWWNTSSAGDPKLILKACVSNSLKLVDDAGLKSIAFPAISCGVFGGHVDVCIPLIQEAVYDYFATTQNSGIKKVHFVENGRQDILDAFSKFPENKMRQKQTTPAPTGHVQSLQGGVSQQVASTVNVHLIQGDIVSYQAFNAAFNLTTPNVTGSQSFPSQSPNVGVRSKKRSHSFVIDNSTNSNFNLSVGALARLSEEKAEDSSFWMFFYATNLEDIDKAIGYISHETGKEMKKQIIDDDVIGRLTKWENFEIDEIRKTRNVTIDNKSTGYLNRLVFIGLTTEVMEALLQVKEILRKLRDAENCASYVTWQKKTSNNWENYLPRSAHVLETAYQAHLKKKTNNAPEKVKVPEFKKGAVTYHSIDISSLFDKNNQSPPKVRRQPTERSASDLPASWDEMKKGTPSTRIILQTDSQEYQNVLTKFQADGVFNSSIVSIERIQNISLHKQYIAKKAEVTEKLKNFPKPIEQQLFHGTGNDDDILIHGFDRSYAGKHATAFGRGVYFATRASFSHGYAAPNTNGNRRMFLADVITGDYCTGNASMVAPPIRANTSLKNDLYDSVVDNVMAPTIYVIFKDASAYPTYLITYM